MQQIHSNLGNVFSLVCLYIDKFVVHIFCIFFDHVSTYWDDWLRLKENHKGRQFIRPEVCRTYNFGEHVSMSNHYICVICHYLGSIDGIPYQLMMFHFQCS